MGLWKSVTVPCQPASGSTLTAAEDLPAGAFELWAYAELGGETFRQGDVVVAYHHIQERRLYEPPQATIEALDVRLRENARIGYVEGVGDEIVEALEQLGLDVTLLTGDDLTHGDLADVTTIVTGVRAHRVRSGLKENHAGPMS